MKKPIVDVETPFELKNALQNLAKSNRIAEIKHKVDRLKMAQEAIEKFESVDILEEEVVLESGEEVVLFSIRGDSSDGVAVAKADLDSGAITRKQCCDNLLGLTCQN